MNRQSRSKISQQLIDIISYFKHKQHTQKIIVQSELNKTSWFIFMCFGKLVWTEGGIHPNRS